MKILFFLIFIICPLSLNAENAKEGNWCGTRFTLTWDQVESELNTYKNVSISYLERGYIPSTLADIHSFENTFTSSIYNDSLGSIRKGIKELADKKESSPKQTKILKNFLELENKVKILSKMKEILRERYKVATLKCLKSGEGSFKGIFPDEVNCSDLRKEFYAKVNDDGYLTNHNWSKEPPGSKQQFIKNFKQAKIDFLNTLK